jgi:DNA-binding response OmpR family regulator
VEPLPITRGSERVLLLEADDVVCKMIAGILTADGYRVYAAPNATAAIALAEEATQPMELFIGPLADPEAAAVARMLLARRAGTRLLDIGPEDSSQAFTLLPAGQLARLAKPFALSELLKIARHLLDS